MSTKPTITASIQKYSRKSDGSLSATNISGRPKEYVCIVTSDTEPKVNLDNKNIGDVIDPHKDPFTANYRSFPFCNKIDCMNAAQNNLDGNLGSDTYVLKWKSSNNDVIKKKTCDVTAKAKPQT